MKAADRAGPRALRRCTLRLALLVATAAGGPTAAADGPTADAEGIEISCDGSPTEAVLRIPAPADRFVHIVCTKYGHILLPVAGWFWTSPGTFAPVFYPAQMVRDNPAETGNLDYFTAVTVNDLRGTEANAKWSLLASIFKGDRPERALEIIAATRWGSAHRIYLFPNAWGYACSPICSADAAFIMVPANKQPPSW